MIDIVKLLSEKKITEAQKLVFEALDAKKTNRLFEEKKAVASRVFSEGLDPGDGHYGDDSPVDMEKINKIAKARKKTGYGGDSGDGHYGDEDSSSDSKTKKKLKEGRLKDAAIEYEERYGKKPEKTEDLAKLRKDKEADAKKSQQKKINEVSDEMKKRYVKAAGERMKALDKTAVKQVSKLSRTNEPGDKKSINAGLQKTGREMEKRLTGIEKATKNNIQEVSSELLSRYIDKAGKSVEKLEKKAEAQDNAARRVRDPEMKKVAKRAVMKTDLKTLQRADNIEKAKAKAYKKPGNWTE